MPAASALSVAPVSPLPLEAAVILTRNIVTQPSTGQTLDPLKPAGGFLSEFQPHLPTRANDNERRRSIHEKLGLGFSLQSAAPWYPGLRATGYFFDAASDTLTRLVGQFLEFGFTNSAAGGKRGVIPAIGSRLARNLEEDLHSNSHWDIFKNFLKKDQADRIERNARGGNRASLLLNVIEASVFGGFSLTTLHYERKSLHESCSQAVQAESGLPEGKITGGDLRESNNPIVSSAVDRYRRRQNAHLLSGPAFIKSIKSGIVTNAALVTLERLFLNPTIALDALKLAIGNVQIYELGDVLAKGELTNNLMKVMQQARLDHRRAPIPHADLDQLIPVLNVVAQDIIDKKVGVPEAVYVMGGGVLVPGNPEQSMQNYRHFQKVGLRGIALEKKAERIHGVPASGFAAQVIASRGGERDRPASTEPAALRRLQGELTSRPAIHGGFSNEVGNRLGVGPTL